MDTKMGLLLTAFLPLEVSRKKEPDQSTDYTYERVQRRSKVGQGNIVDG
jgi:hypothetical protein